MQKARTVIDPDTVIATVDGVPLTWKLFYYFISGNLQEIYYYTGSLPEDFNVEYTPGTTWKQYMYDSALNQSRYYLEANVKAEELGVELSPEQQAQVDGVWDELLTRYGGEELLQADLEEACLDKDLFLFLLASNEKFSALMEELYGANGEKLTEEQILAWAAENGYVRTKHVLWSFLDESGAALDEEAKAALRDVSIRFQVILPRRYEKSMNGGDFLFPPVSRGGSLDFPIRFRYDRESERNESGETPRSVLKSRSS